VVAGRRVWVPAIAQRLLCTEGNVTADALVLDNLDANYAIFKRAAQIQQAGKINRVFVSAVLEGPDDIDARVVDLMARVSGLHRWEVIATDETEPVALHAAMRVRRVLARENIRSIMLVSPGFRSRRTFLAYRSVLDGAAIGLECVPVIEEYRTVSWTGTWHGIQEVVLQLLKLEYYRLYVLPKRAFSH
jgi:hypothetical protein